MLYLTRRVNGDGITITMPDGNQVKFRVEEIRGKWVKLAFDPFDGVDIQRDEVEERIKAGVPAPENTQRPLGGGYPGQTDLNSLFNKPLLRLNRDSIPVGAQ